MSADHEIDILAEDIDAPEWLERVEGFVAKVLDHQGHRQWSLSVVFCSDSYMQKLNREYRDKDMPTDVLSFAQIDGPDEIPAEGPFYAGDIVISLETLAENARYFEVDEEEELKRLIIHGILHLGGWDHSDNSPEQEMLILQERILSELSGEKVY